MLDRDDLDYLARRRWRRGAQPVRPGRVVFLAFLLTLHLGVLLLVREHSLRARPPAQRQDDVLVVRLLPREQDEPAVVVAPQAHLDRAEPPGARPGAPTGGESDGEAPAPANSAYLFEPDGSLKLPQGVLAPEPTSAFHNPEPTALPALRNPVRYKPTRFESVWVKDHETLGERLVRETTVVKTHDTKNGTRITCVWSPLLMPLAAGCGWGPTPRDPPKPAPWLAVAGETRPETPRPFDPDPFD